MSKKIIILEGLPKSGKTSIINYLSSKGVDTVSEICINDNDTVIHGDVDSQYFFIKNDDCKIKKCYNNSSILVVVDRGPVSTLAYNLTKFGLDKKHNFFEVLDWFNSINIRKFYNNASVIYLRGRRKATVANINDPYGSLANLNKLENITLGLLKAFNIKHKIIDYDCESNNDFKRVVDEIIN